MKVRDLVNELSKYDSDLTILDNECEQPGELYLEVTEDGLVVGITPIE